jgi:hypothetical protein
MLLLISQTDCSPHKNREIFWLITITAPFQKLSNSSWQTTMYCGTKEELKDLQLF